MTSDAAAPILSTTAPGQPIVARAGQYYRNTRYVMAIICILYAAWSCYDGFYNWQEPHWSEVHPDVQPYPPLSIHLNQAIGIVLPILVIAFLIRMFHVSRGEYRLENGVVSIPGHPPIPLDAIQAIDRKLWDRKGIAVVEYKIPGSPPVQGKFRLDDFLYDRLPTDEIFKAIETSMLKAAAAARPAPPPGSSAISRLAPRRPPAI